MINYKKIIEYFFSNYYLHGPSERLSIGERVSKANTLFNTRSGNINVGDGVIFGHNCMVLTGMHEVSVRGSMFRRKTIEDANNNIVIESGCWIGSGTIILGGVRIGKDSVIGAGSIVVKDIPADSFAAGNPCKVIKPLEYL